MSKEKAVRFTARFDPDSYDKLKYWAAKRNLSVNEYLELALEHMIAWENSDYDLPRAEIARLNQLIDAMTSLSSNIKSLEDVTVSGFESLIGLTKGDSNYLSPEDGEL